MKRFAFLLVATTCSIGMLADDPSRAAAIAEREAAEERYKSLNSAVEGVLAAQADQQRRFAALTQEIKSLRDDQTRNSNYATRDELNRLVEAVKEIDRKREADKKQILEEIANLGKALTAAPTTTRKSAAPAADDKSPESHPNQEGVWYSIQKGNTLVAIATAHNEELKDKGKATSVKQILDANPNLSETRLPIGKKIFIPLSSR